MPGLAHLFNSVLQKKMVDEHDQALGGQRRTVLEAREQLLVTSFDLRVKHLGLPADTVRTGVDDGVKLGVL